MNGSCTNFCPVKINIHEQFYKWRQIVAEQHEFPFIKKEAMKVAGKVLAEARPSVADTSLPFRPLGAQNNQRKR
jgi:L-lactate utilization protein LutB